MKILHTSDWHVGKVLKGRDRYDEHAAVLGSIVRTARDEDVDVVLIAGDLFETAAPNAKAQGLVMRTLLALREDGRQVVVIAGNHDNQDLLDAVYRPVLGQLGLHVLGLPKRPEPGRHRCRCAPAAGRRPTSRRCRSCRTGTRSAPPRCCCTSFAEHSPGLRPAGRAPWSRLLTEGFTGDAVNLVMAHATLLGGRRGGGERDVQTSLGLRAAGQHVPADRALRRARPPAPVPGDPRALPDLLLRLAAGHRLRRGGQRPVVLIVTAAPGIRADARPVPVTGGRPLRTLRGTLDQVIAEGEQAGRRLPAGGARRAGPGGPGRPGPGEAAEHAGGDARRRAPAPARQPQRGPGEPGRPEPAGAVRRLPDRGERRATRGLTAMFAELLDEVTSDPIRARAVTGEA